MPMFGFDEQYAYYGVTPVDNRFILEYLPNATGDAVRVYLYGLVQCYNPDQDLTIEKVAAELGMTEDDVLRAYRYWERKGFVRRIKDKPPVFQYVNSQKAFSGDSSMVDFEFEEFTADVQRLFPDRRLHGNEMIKCYELVEQVGLPREVVLYLIEHMIRMHGKNVAMTPIEKRALLLADEKVQTADDARVILDFDRRVLTGCRDIVSRMGKRRNPTEPELKMYRSWLVDWKYTEEDIVAACEEMTGGDPSFKYLNGILRRVNEQRNGEKLQKVAEIMQQEKDAAAPLKALLKVMNLPSVTINEGTLAVYADMRALYPDNIILMAGKECAKRGSDFEGVMTTLRNWKRNGLENTADITRYMKQVDDENDFLLMLYEVLGVSVKPNAADRRLAKKWQADYGYDMTFITQCAAWAVGKEKPMAYLDKVLSNFYEKGVRDMTSAEKEHEEFRKKMQAQPAAVAPRGPKTVEQQQYTQREYTHTEDAMDAMMKKWQEENAHA